MLESSSQQTEPRQPDPGEAETRPTAWWRNQRRWFYLIVTLLPLALLWGGWSWWYRSNFPMLPMVCRKGGRNPFEDAAPRHSWRDDLYHWKIRRETFRMRLEGTVWVMPSDPLFRMEFGRNGHLRIRVQSAWKEEYFKWQDQGIPGLDALSRFDGARWRVLQTNEYSVDNWGSPIPSSVNLEIEGLPYDLRWVSNGDQLWVYSNRPGLGWPERLFSALKADGATQTVP